MRDRLRQRLTGFLTTVDLPEHVRLQVVETALLDLVQAEDDLTNLDRVAAEMQRALVQTQANVTERATGAPAEVGATSNAPSPTVGAKVGWKLLTVAVRKQAHEPTLTMELPERVLDLPALASRAKVSAREVRRVLTALFDPQSGPLPARLGLGEQVTFQAVVTIDKKSRAALFGSVDTPARSETRPAMKVGHRQALERLRKQASARARAPRDQVEAD